MDVLLGKTPPAGRIPYTWYAKGWVEERGALAQNDLRGGRGITYRYYQGDKVLLPFGWGLSYTNWTYSWATAPSPASTAQLAASGLTVDVEVANTGAVSSDVVVLVFVSRDGPGCPIRTLGGFMRLTLAAGSKTTTKIKVKPRQLACVNEQGQHKLLSGPLRIEAGDRVSPATANVTVTGPSLSLPEDARTFLKTDDGAGMLSRLALPRLVR